MASMLRFSIAGTLAASLEQPLRRRLAEPCDIVVSDETGIVALLADVDVLLTMVFTSEMGCRANRLKLVQVAGAGLDRIDRAALRAGAALANVFGHETEIAEYAIGAMPALTREFTASTPRCGRVTGSASGRSARRYRRCGRNWPARPSIFSATAGPAGVSLGAPSRSI
jgi:phosphoglycerate dehydrogenase-like enzyme